MSVENIRSRFPLRFSLAFSAIFILVYWPGVLLLPYHGLFHHMEDLAQDRLFRFNEGRLSLGDERLILAAMDDDTGKAHGFPMPRAVLARLLDRLKAYGVKTVVFDVMFFEPREGDAELAAATKRFGRVVHLFTTETKLTPVGEVVTVNPPVKALGASAQHLGYPNIDHVIDDDGHIRRVLVFDERAHNPRKPEEMAQSMDLAGMRSFEEKSYEEMVSRYADPSPRILSLNFRRPKIWMKHEKASEKLVGKVADLPTVESPYRTISVMDLLSAALTPEQKKALKGSLVIVGSTALGYFDHYPTPFTPQAPGPEYHANVMDNMLHGDFMRQVSRGWTLLVILFMIWLPMGLLNLPPALGAAAVAAIFLAWLGFAQWRFTAGVRVEAVAPLAALLSAFLVQTVHRVLTEGQEKRFIKNLFGQFVAPEVVEDLAKDPGKVKLGGEKRDMTVFFLDIAHFTTISEKMPPEGLIIFLNKYLSALSQVVHEQKGVVDKYIGDCIMAFWNAPLPLEDHRLRGCLAAIECQERMKTLNVELGKDGVAGLKEPPAIRIGLNSGTMTVGLTGSEKKLQYTVIGDEVNLASRLEGANKFFGSHIMVSESTYKGAKDAVEARELGQVRVVGKEKPIRVFELLSKRGQLSDEWKKALPHYQKGQALFLKRKYDQAALEFQEVLKVFPKDGPAALYLNASRDYIAIPPPADWDGVFNLTAK